MTVSAARTETVESPASKPRPGKARGMPPVPCRSRRGMGIEGQGVGPQARAASRDARTALTSSTEPSESEASAEFRAPPPVRFGHRGHADCGYRPVANPIPDPDETHPNASRGADGAQTPFGAAANALARAGAGSG